MLVKETKIALPQLINNATMNSKNPQELIDEVQQEQQTRSEVAKQVLQWFLDGNQQELFPREEVVEQISEELDLSLERAQLGITDTVGDIVDPVQQVISKQKYVGIIDYKVFADEGAYGYVGYDDRRGNRKRVVCARCVKRAQYDEEVVHATQGEGSSSEDASWQQLLNKITSHYANSHTKVPENIEPGASLVNGTTISGNTAFHEGNENLIDAGVSDHSQLSGIGANDHHSENHGNEDHTSNYITDPGVTSVNGQSGSVSVQEDDLAWTRQAEYQLSNIEGQSAEGSYFEYPIPNAGDNGVTGVRLAFAGVTISQVGSEMRLRVGSQKGSYKHLASGSTEVASGSSEDVNEVQLVDGEITYDNTFNALVELNTVGGVTFFTNTSFTLQSVIESDAAERGFINAPLEGNGVTFVMRYLKSGSVVVWTR